MDKMKPVFQALNKELIQENGSIISVVGKSHCGDYRAF